MREITRNRAKSGKTAQPNREIARRIKKLPNKAENRAIIETSPKSDTGIPKTDNRSDNVKSVQDKANTDNVLILDSTKPESHQAAGSLPSTAEKPAAPTESGIAAEHKAAAERRREQARVRSARHYANMTPEQKKARTQQIIKRRRERKQNK
ncbi:MAG: hypothetical protein KGI50_06710 [Patescibacteria group bacterium]|nr:hypothetical protein [Patescibacteria group bacterium]